MALKIDGDEVKSIKALVVSLNGVFKIIDEKLDGLVDSIKTLYSRCSFGYRHRKQKGYTSG